MKRTCKGCHKEYEIPDIWERLASLGFIPFNEWCPNCMIQRYDWIQEMALAAVLESGNPLSYLYKSDLVAGGREAKRAAKRVIAFMQEEPDKDPRMLLFKDEYKYTPKPKNNGLIV